jgi:hypothetical protein
VANKPGTPRRSRISRNTIAQGMPERFGVPVVTCLRAFYIARKAAGAAEHPAFPVPSDLWGTRFLHDPGKTCRGNANCCPVAV